MKQCKFYIIFSIAIFLTSCGSLKDGFSKRLDVARNDQINFTTVPLLQ